MRLKISVLILRGVIAALPLLYTSIATAEPYFAVREGFKCAQCHVNPTGGGLRNVFGNAYAQSQLPATRIDTGDVNWTGAVGSILSLGGDFRGDASVTNVPQAPQSRAFEVSQARVYLNLGVIPDRLSIYLDELVAPGASSNREAYVRYQASENAWSIKAGQMYLPFGLRLQDESAFTRVAPGINMTNPDTGVEFSWEPGSWSTQLAISNGSGIAGENNVSKQFTAQAAFVQRNWRVGLAADQNGSPTGDRDIVGLFAGLNTGPITWLVEADYIDDKGIAGGERKSIAGLLEGNWLVKRGHNLKITAEKFDPDRDASGDYQSRYSAVYEYTPIQYLQLRTGIRYYSGPSQIAVENRRTAFLELHGFF